MPTLTRPSPTDLAAASALALLEAKYNAQQLKALGAKGQALKNDAGDWSYPIADEQDLRNAIRAVGRGSSSHDKIRRYIKGRAKAMGKSDLIPDNWSASGAMKEAAVSQTELAVHTSLAEAVRGTPTGRRMEIQLITPGWGASGYYSEATLKQAARDKVFPAGTQMYIDHQTLSEQADRVHGERSLKDLAARFTGDARWDGKGLVAEVEVTNPTWRPVITDMREHVGVSIRALGEGETGEAAGKQGLIINKIDQAMSVDFVAEAGRGGRVLALLESARDLQLREGHGMTANDLSDALRTAVKDAHGGPKRYAWMRDYTDDWVVYQMDVEGGDGNGLFQQMYSIDEATKAITLDGDPVEVKISTSYVPVKPPVATSESAEPEQPPADSTDVAETGQPADTDGTETTDETEAAESATSDVPADQAPDTTTPLEEGDPDMGQENTSPGTARHLMERELAEARRERDIVKARESARRVLAEALNDAWIPPATVTRITESLLERLPVTDGVLDETELVKMAGREAERAEREMAEALEAAGMGRPRDLGFGADGGNQAMGLGEAETGRRLETAFAGLGLSESVAKRAAKGRG